MGAAALIAIIGGGLLFHHRKQRRLEAGRQRHIAELEGQRDRLAAILEHMPQGIVVAEAPGGRIISVNERQVEAIVRHPVRYSAGINHYGEWMGWHADGRPIRPEEWPLARALQQGEISRNVEVQYLFGDNRRGWLSISAAPVRDAQGNIVAGVTMFHDVTEQKWMEELLQQREERYRALLMLTATIVWTAAPDGQILADVPEWEAFTGQTPRQYKGMGWLQAIHPEDRGPTLDYWREHIHSRKPMDWVYRLRRRDGRYRHVALRGVPVFDEQAQAGAMAVREWFGTCTDIEEQRRAEQNLIDNEKQLRLAMETGRLGAWQIDLLNNEMECSPACRAMFGFSADAPVSRPAFGERIHPEDRPRLERAMEEAIENGSELDIEYRCRWPDGTVHWIHSRGRATRLERGRPRRMNGVTLDITARKAMEQHKTQLLEAERAARSEAERIGRIKDEFLATLSHELRTPLNAILGWSQILQEPNLPPEELKQGLEVIERNTRIQAQLIEDLLDLSRIISGKLRLSTRPLDLPAVIEAAIESVRPAAEARQIELLTELDPAAGAVRGDPGRLQQVVWNLLSNAVKFTPHRGQVRIALRRVESNVEIEVSDNGAGIAPGVLPHVFDRFRQGDSSTTRKHGGLGLGLAIVKQLVEVHGGTVSAQSEGEGRGATFRVHLPLLAVQGDAPPHPAESAEGDAPDLRGMHVLVVDDEPDARDMVRRVLEHGGARVCAAGSADEAVEMLRQFKPDILLSDIGMPHRDGFDLIREIRALPPEGGGDIPAAALTAFARAEDRERALTSGYQTHLAKPIEPAALLAAVANLAGRG